MRIIGILITWSIVYLQAAVHGAENPQLNLDNYDPTCGIEIIQQDTLIHVLWPMEADRQGRMTIDLATERPLIRSLTVRNAQTDGDQTIAEALDPVLLLRVGDRNLDRAGGWTIFFDRMQSKPHDVHFGQLDRSTAAASSHAQRATVTVGDLTLGPFEGVLRWTFYAGSQFVLQEAIVSTQRERTAYLYDAGLVCRAEAPRQMVWREPLGQLASSESRLIEQPKPLAVRGRAVAAQYDSGALVLFPPPHRYFYPLDFSDNLKNVWIGPDYGGAELPFGFGVRHDPRGDNRFVPWFNAPPGTEQELGLFLLVSDQSADGALEEVARLTRHDRFEPLPGHKVFTSHFHVEHTEQVLQAQDAADSSDGMAAQGQLPSGDTYRIPERLVEPGFTRVFRDMGVDIAHLAEFHFGRTPRMPTAERLHHLEVLHAECRRLSDDKFLLLPGEEPNVHLGGHWISFFPQPVYWVLNRPEGTPFVREHPQLGRVYHVGSEADVLRLLQAERGLAWTAHPRIKSSLGFPDNYRDRLFFTSDRFLGAAWKAMPADLSQPRLGTRVLDLLDDMANWGAQKYVLGEVDVFKIQPDHELYGHMNVNYLRLDELPRFDDGWQAVLGALRNGAFFVTTGEVLIPEFTVRGQQSGNLASLSDSGMADVRFRLKWTFPLAYAEIISGDGQEVRRQRVNLTSTRAFGEETFEVDADLAGQHWVRLEVWDVATNGAFTQPVWLRARSAGR